MATVVIKSDTREIVGVNFAGPIGTPPAGQEYQPVDEAEIRDALKQPGHKFLSAGGTVDVVPPTPEELAAPTLPPAPAIAVLADGKAAIEQSVDFSAGQKALLGPLFDGLIQSLSSH
jgi:hypothetical protein